MKQAIINELKKLGIEAVGINESLPQIIEDAIDFVKTVSFEEWLSKTCMSEKLKNIVKRLAI